MNRPLRDGALASAFDAGAKSYDTLVGRNPGYHEHLRLSARRLAARLGTTDGEGLRLLDVGCGTGASTAALLSVAPKAEIVGVDAADAMLDQARAKPWPDRVSFVHSPVEGLAAAGVAGPFDGVFGAYLMRNLADPDQQLRALRELLTPNGTLAVHDYFAGDTPWARARWHTVCWTIVIPLAAANGGGTKLYRHLWRSVKDFDTAAEFHRRLENAGYRAVEETTMQGWQKGIEYSFLARR